MNSMPNNSKAASWHSLLVEKQKMEAEAGRTASSATARCSVSLPLLERPLRDHFSVNTGNPLLIAEPNPEPCCPCSTFNVSSTTWHLV
jgi:hypothetical protein